MSSLHNNRGQITLIMALSQVMDRLCHHYIHYQYPHYLLTRGQVMPSLHSLSIPSLLLTRGQVIVINTLITAHSWTGYAIITFVINTLIIAHSWTGYATHYCFISITMLMLCQYPRSWTGYAIIKVHVLLNGLIFLK